MDGSQKLSVKFKHAANALAVSSQAVAVATDQGTLLLNAGSLGVMQVSTELFWFS